MSGCNYQLVRSQVVCDETGCYAAGAGASSGGGGGVGGDVIGGDPGPGHGQGDEDVPTGGHGGNGGDGDDDPGGDHDGDGDGDPGGDSNVITCRDLGWLQCGQEAECAIDGSTGQAQCSCAPGYQDLDHDLWCEPTCENTTVHCVNGSCALVDGTPTCQCNPGYQDQDQDGTCELACEDATCAAPLICNDLYGPAVCECVIYVDASSKASPADGNSWSTAFPDLIQALVDHNSSAQRRACVLWVAEGTYTPPEIFGVQLAITTPVTIYGGFPSGASSYRQRAPLSRHTIIQPKAQDAPALHINNTDNVLLDGLVLTGAEAANGSGGGLFVLSSQNVTVQNSQLAYNQAGSGAGAAVWDATVSFRNVQFVGNQISPGGSGVGGGLFVDAGSTVTLSNVVFSDNVSERGGAIFVAGGSVHGEVVAVVNNSGGFGSTLTIESGGNVSLSRAVFARNYGVGGMVEVRNASLTITNGLFIGNGSPLSQIALFGVGGPSGSTLTVGSSTFYKTLGQGPLMEVTVGSAELINSLLWDNNLSPVATVSAGALAEVSYSGLPKGLEVCSGAGTCQSPPSTLVALTEGRFAHLPPPLAAGGTWSSPPSERGGFRPYLSEITVVGRTYAPGELRGLLLLPDEVPTPPLLIVDNTDSSILVLGNTQNILTSVASGAFTITSVEPAPDSPAVDAAQGDVAPSRDIFGRPRRDVLPTVDTGTGITPYADMGCFEGGYIPGGVLGGAPATATVTP